MATTGALTALSLGLILTTSSPYQPLEAALGFCYLGYLITDRIIPKVSHAFERVGLKGKDLNKHDTPVVPETMGVIPAVTYLFIMFTFIPFMFLKFLVVETKGGGSIESGIESQDFAGLFPHNKLSSYLSGMLSMESMILLGLLDDLFDIRWRHKFFFPAIAAIPLLIVYYVDFNVTSILVPEFVQKWVPGNRGVVDLGFLYYIYMASVAIFCPNSINILAGVNGLETGQSVVMGILILLNDLCYLVPHLIMPESHHPPSFEAHMFSACIIVPYLGVALALLKWNWFPARVFVGDTFCYFSGMVFVIVGILGHFSKTLLLFFIPQILNFLYSTPQLFHLIPCPRHRLPKFSKENGKLYPSRVVFEKPLNRLATLLIKSLAKLKLLDVELSGKEIKNCSNMTIINLVLVWTGPLREDALCMTLLLIQFGLGLVSLVLRHIIGKLLFGYDNLAII